MQTKKANKWEHGRGSKEFSSRLRYVMGEKEISQSALIALAQEKLDMQLNKGAVSDWYNGKKKPQIKNICILASVLECNRIWLEANHYKRRNVTPITGVRGRCRVI